MELKELYELIDEIGCFTFSTMGEKGEIQSRIAHFNGFDEEGIYFRTMTSKPYYRGKVDVFDTDFELTRRDHKVLRTRFSFNGYEFNLAGPRITNKCIECGLCKQTCSFNAIEAGSPYKINPSRCDDCGMCMHVCPVNAIEESLEF